MRITSPPLTQKQKNFLKRSKGIKAPFSLDTPAAPLKKIRAFNAPRLESYVPCKMRGNSGTRLSHETRLKILQRHEARREFFAGLGVRL